MGNVSIILATRQYTGNNDVEIVLECEFEYNALVLCCCSSKIIGLAKSLGGKMIPWTKEPEKEKFCHVFRFESEDLKQEFLDKINKIW